MFGTAVEYELIPKISYDYTSKKEQSAIPIFDTKDDIDKILTYSTLLSGERYKGVDRFVNEKEASIFNPSPSDIYLSTIGTNKKLNP